MKLQNFVAKVEGGIAILAMKRPPVNAFDQAMYIETAQIFADPDRLFADLKAIVLTGEGRNFCGGNDLDEFATMTPDNGSERMWRVREAFFAIQECPVPVIGAVAGAAVGTGLAVAASCDFIVAATDARFGLPELNVGVMGGARHLARIAPTPLVKRMFLTSELMRADAFAAAGGAVFVCEPADLMATALGYARKIAAHSGRAVRTGKRILNRIETMDVRQGYEFEQRFTVRLSGDADAKEALAAVQERRSPVFASPPRADPLVVD